MKLALTTTLLRPGQGIFDGCSVYTRQILQGLPACGWQVLPYEPLSYRRALLRGILRPAPAPADLLHVTDYRVERMACPVVATLYDAIPMARPEYANQRWRGLKNALMRHVARYADHIVCISEYAAAEVAHYYGVAAERMSIIPCGIDDAWLQTLPQAAIEDVRRRRALPPSYVLAVGTLQPRKNFSRLLQAHQQLPAALRREHPLVLVGRPGWDCAELIAQLQQAAATGTVYWLADVASLQELRALYAGAGLFALPSLHEGFGLPLLEAFASSLPVLIHAGSSLPEVSAGAALDVDAEDTAALCRGLQRLLTERTEAKERAQRGRRRAEQLTASAMNRGLATLYGSLL